MIIGNVMTKSYEQSLWGIQELREGFVNLA